MVLIVHLNISAMSLFYLLGHIQIGVTQHLMFTTCRVIKLVYVVNIYGEVLAKFHCTDLFVPKACF